MQFLALTRLEVNHVLRSPAFVVLLALGLFNALGALLGVTQSRGVDYLPVTRALASELAGAYTLIPILIAIFYGGELVWRDRERRMRAKAS